MDSYIWYIVGGIVLFFIIVGFVADKSGLAKKTFRKNNTTPVKKEKEQNEEVITNDISTLENTNEEAFVQDEVQVSVDDNNDNNVHENVDVVENDNNDFLNQEEVQPVMEDNYENEAVEYTDSLGNIEYVNNELENEVSEDNQVYEEKIYLNDEVEADEESHDILGKAYLEIDESVDETEKKINSELEQENSVASEDAEIEWGISEDDMVETKEGLEDVELPDLSDLNIGEDEDVWKF